MERSHVTASVVDGGRPGGANTSHTIAVELLVNLLAAGGRDATFATYQRIAVDQNVLGRSTYEGRRRTFRYLRELYVLDATNLLFRALRELWLEDQSAVAQLAGISALARDASLRASAHAVLPARQGSVVRADDIARILDTSFPGVYNAATLHKIGRNAASSWTQTGHLSGRTAKVRVSIEAKNVAVAYAVFVGHLAGHRGADLLATVWTDFLDLPREELLMHLREASQRGYLEFRDGGGVMECEFRHLSRPVEKGAP